MPLETFEWDEISAEKPFVHRFKYSQGRLRIVLKLQLLGQSNYIILLHRRETVGGERHSDEYNLDTWNHHPEATTVYSATR